MGLYSGTLTGINTLFSVASLHNLHLHFSIFIEDIWLLLLDFFLSPGLNS